MLERSIPRTEFPGARPENQAEYSIKKAISTPYRCRAEYKLEGPGDAQTIGQPGHSVVVGAGYDPA
jgi:hypothetical protein